MYANSGAGLNALLGLCQASSQAVEERLVPRSDAEWSTVLDCAAKHGLTGLLYKSAADSGCLPPSVRLLIQSAARTQAARNCYLAVELVEILAALLDRDIRALAIKGPVLAIRAYGHLADREFCDLDILVNPVDLERAGLVLYDRGYRTSPKTATLRERSRQGANHDIFLRAEDGATVELHWQLISDLERIPLTAAGVWSRAQTVPVLNRPLPALAIEDTLLFLCLHGFKHRWSRLKWLADIAYLMRSEEPVNWNALLSRSGEIGCKRLVIVGISLAVCIFGGAIPPAIREAASADPPARRLTEEMRSTVLHDNPLNDVQWAVCYLQLHERFRRQAVLCFRLLGRIWRLTAEDDLPSNHTARDLLLAACNRPARLYRSYGLEWAKPLLGLARLR